MLEALDAGMESLNAQSNSMFWQQHTEVISATQQVVAGFKWVIQIRLGSSQCPKAAESHSLVECPVNDSELYELQILEQDWMTPKYTLLSHGMALIYDPPEATEAPSQPVGSAQPVSILDGPMLEALDAGMESLNAQSNSMFWQQHTEVISATQQVVAGFKWVIQIRLGSSQCPKTSMISSHDLTSCPVDGGTELHELVISEQAWSTPRYTLRSHSAVSKTGTESTQISKNSAVQEALQAAMQQWGTKEFYQIISVTKSTVEIYEGKTVWAMTVELGQTDCMNDSQTHTLDECPIAATKLLRDLVVEKHSSGQYQLTSPHPCAMFKCMGGCTKFAVSASLCQDGCKCADTQIETSDSSEQESSQEEDWNQTKTITYAITFGFGLAALLLVPAVAFWSWRRQNNARTHDPVATDEIQISSPPHSTNLKIEEGDGLVTAHSQL